MAKGYLGPAAQSFLAAELHAMGVNANSVSEADVAALAMRVRERAARVMGERKASHEEPGRFNSAPCSANNQSPSIFPNHRSMSLASPPDTSATQFSGFEASAARILRTTGGGAAS